jgi:putative ABC transport system permease protein
MFRLESWMSDLRDALRTLRAAPGFTVPALVVLTLGIGSSTAIFSVVDAVVLRALPFDEHDRLVAVGERRQRSLTAQLSPDPEALAPIAPQNYMDWAGQQKVFESMSAFAYGAFTLREPGGEPEELRTLRVTAAFFDVLRVRPAMGRVFSAENEIDGKNRLSVLSDGLWRRRFGADPLIIGRTIPLEGGSYEVIGVMPPGFAYPVATIRPTDLWVPYVVPPNERTRVAGSRGYYLQSIARLSPGVSIQQAQAQMDQVAAALEQTHPVWNKDHRIGIRRLNDHLVGATMRSWMLMLLGAVAIVLLIACANVANLFLARGSAREREVGIRAALGAGRWRLVRQLIVESLVLSSAGTLLAMLVAWWGIEVLRASMPENVPRVTGIALNFRVLAAAAGLSIGTGLLFGVFPAVQLSRPDLTAALKHGARGISAGGARQRMRSALVIAEVALAVVLLVGAALFIGSFLTLMRIAPGFNPERVLTAVVFPRSVPGFPPPDPGPAFVEVVERISKIPGVLHAAAISGGIPLGGSMSITDMTVPGRTLQNDRGVSIRSVTPEYHQALQIPLRSGRLLEPTDRKGAPNVITINEAAERKYFPGEDPLGGSVTIDKHSWTIVGIVGDVRQSSIETEPLEEVYVPIAQRSRPTGELVIRTSGNPYDVLPAVKSAVLSVLPDVPLRNVRTMEELLAVRVAQRRLNMLLMGLFGSLGLVISVAGIYGVIAYAVGQRTREIGVRMALGATRSKVVGMVLTNACMLVLAGLIIRGVGAWYLSATAKTFLFGLEAHDPLAFIAALLVLAISAIIASAVPARRAASVDPIVALRTE